MTTHGQLLRIVLEYCKGDTKKIKDGVTKALQKVTDELQKNYLRGVLEREAKEHINGPWKNIPV